MMQDDAGWRPTSTEVKVAQHFCLMHGRCPHKDYCLDQHRCVHLNPKPRTTNEQG